MKRISILLLIVVGLLVGQSAYAQTTINTTTVATAVTTPTPTVGPANSVVLTSIGSGATAVARGMTLFIDGEAMTVTATPTTTTVSVSRGRTRPTPHAVGAIVYYGNNQAFVSGTSGVQFYQGACTSTDYSYLPIIDTVNATIGTCADSVWKWTRLSAESASTVPYHAVASAAYTASLNDYIIAYTAINGGAYTVTLPSPSSGIVGKVYIIKNASSMATNTIWLGGTVDGQPGQVLLGAYAVTRLFANASGWFTF